MKGAANEDCDGSTRPSRLSTCPQNNRERRQPSRQAGSRPELAASSLTFGPEHDGMGERAAAQGVLGRPQLPSCPDLQIERFPQAHLRLVERLGDVRRVEELCTTMAPRKNACSMNARRVEPRVPSVREEAIALSTPVLSIPSRPSLHTRTLLPAATPRHCPTSCRSSESILRAGCNATAATCGPQTSHEIRAQGLGLRVGGVGSRVEGVGSSMQDGTTPDTATRSSSSSIMALCSCRIVLVAAECAKLPPHTTQFLTFTSCHGWHNPAPLELQLT